MKKIVVFIVVTFYLMADSIAIATGSDYGEYHKLGELLAKKVGGKVLESQGSLDNLELVDNNRSVIGITQADAYVSYLSNHKHSNLTIATKVGEEAVLLVTYKYSGINSDADIQKKGVKVAIGLPNSGTQLTYKIMSRLEPKYKNATTINLSVKKAIVALIRQEVDAAIFVQKPNIDGWLFKTVRGNKNLKFVDITDWDLDNRIKIGNDYIQVYKFKKINYDRCFVLCYINTITIPTYLVYNSKADKNVTEIIDDITVNPLINSLN